jgi:hypothetical protein
MARRLNLRAWLTMAAVLAMACGRAAADDLYSVGGIAVDRTAATAQQARDAAIAEAEQKAFAILMRRLTEPSQAARLPQPSGRDLAELVQGFQVESERASATRYVATLDIAFQPDAVRQLLATAGVGAVQVAARPLLVVPLYHAGGRTLLWEDGNGWRQAWAEHPPHTGLVTLVLPEGDAADLEALDAEDAAAAKPGAFDSIMSRYHTGGALLVDATPESGGVAVKAVELGGGKRDVFAGRIAREAGESDRALLARAAQAIGEALEDRLRRDNLVTPGSGGTVTAQIPLDGLNSWLAVRRDLQSVGVVQRLALRALSKREATVDIAFAGDQTQLAAALAQTGWRLERAGDSWILRGRAPAASSARP